MDSDLLGLQCGIFSIDPLSALCPLWERKERNKEKETETTRLTGKMKGLIFLLAVEAAVVVCTNTAITIRIPSLMVERGLGDAQLSSLVLSIHAVDWYLGRCEFFFLYLSI